MPRRCLLHPRFDAVVAGQDGLLSRRQALALGLTNNAISHRLATRQWQLVLPEILLTLPTPPTRRQNLIAARLHAGDNTVIDGLCACRYHGFENIPPDDGQVRVVLPWGKPARSHDFVVVRRTTLPIEFVETDYLKYLAPAAAAVMGARELKHERSAFALLAEGLQRKLVSYDELLLAQHQAPPKHRLRVDRMLGALGTGVLAVSENDFRILAQTSRILPSAEYNVLLRLPSGRVISPDALYRSAGLVHETNGRKSHAAEDRFESMQERHDVMTASGLTVLHNSPRQVRREGSRVLGELEQCFCRLDGQGLPPGVEVIDPVTLVAIAGG